MAAAATANAVFNIEFIDASWKKLHAPKPMSNRVISSKQLTQPGVPPTLS
jgi:hypothetical protein